MPAIKARLSNLTLRLTVYINAADSATVDPHDVVGNVDDSTRTDEL